MKIFALFLIALCTSVHAETDIFDIYYYSSNEIAKQPHWLEIYTDAQQNLTGLRVFAKVKKATVVLFSLNAAQVKDHLKATKNKNSLSVYTKKDFRSSYNGSYNNSYYGDASVEVENDYCLEFNITNGCTKPLIEDYEHCIIDISDNSAGEMAIMGSLIKRTSL